MKEIPLTRGKVALVDDEDYAELAKHKWFADENNGGYYAGRNVPCPDGKRRKVFMHRLILGLVRGDGKQADHINHNGLDNRRKNLRVCTAQQNRFNKRVLKGSSKYKGVTSVKGKWKARICHNYKTTHIGTYKTQVEAAQAYDAKAHQLFREFALTNF